MVGNVCFWFEFRPLNIRQAFNAVLGRNFYHQLQVFVGTKLQYGKSVDNILFAEWFLEEIFLLFSAIRGSWRFFGDDIFRLAFVGICLISICFF